jgi:hypothetical protein
LEIFGPFYAARHIYAGIASSLLPLSLSGGIVSKPQFCSLSKSVCMMEELYIEEGGYILGTTIDG